MQAQKYGQILQVFLLDISQESRGFSDSFMMDCDRIAKEEALLLENFDQKICLNFCIFMEQNFSHKN